MMALGVASFPLEDLSHVIQLSIAPVFLLSAIGTILIVLSTRLGRIVDRMRVQTERMETAATDHRAKMKAELKTLHRRRRLIDMAIAFATVSALIVCLVIAMAFLGYILKVRTGLAMATLFVIAMFAFIGALTLFLSEVLYAGAVMYQELA